MIICSSVCAAAVAVCAARNILWRNGGYHDLIAKMKNYSPKSFQESKLEGLF